MANVYRLWLQLALIVFINSFSVNSMASDELRELEYAEKIESAYSLASIGKVIWLQEGQDKFLALYTETEKKENLGTAIILHSMGEHPDHGKLINPLRTYLPQHNWSTLSLQMPVLSVGAKEEEYYPLFDDANKRIQAGINYLVVAGIENIVLIGESLGGVMAAYFIKENELNVDVKAIVAVSLSVPKSDQKQAQVIDFISEITQPFLDIYTEHDVSEVVGTARKRRIAGKANLAYRQFKIEGEGYNRQHNEGLIVKRIYSWINWTFKE